MGTTGGYAFDPSGETLDPSQTPLNFQQMLLKQQQAPQAQSPFASAQTFGQTSSPFTAQTNVNQPGPVAAAPGPTGAPTQGDPSKGGFIVPPGSLPPPVVSDDTSNLPTSHQTDSSFAQYNSDPVIKAIEAAIQSGMSGSALVNFVKQRNPSAQVSTGRNDTQIYYGTGGSNGYQIDMNAAGVWGVHPYSDGGTAGGGGGSVNTSPPPSVDLSGAINSANITTSGPLAGKSNSFLDLLMNRANESLLVNPQDPIVKAQTDAYAASGERQLRNYLSSAAEKAGPGGNIEAITRSANENLAQADASFTGQVLQNELNARRQEVAQALSLYGSTLTSEQQMQLQEELAKLDAAISEAQIQQGAYQFDVNQQDRLAGV